MNCLVKKSEDLKKGRVLTVSLSENNTGFVVRFGDMFIDFELEIDRFYFNIHRNLISLKRGEPYALQLSRRGYIRRSFLTRLPGALFERSRILVELRPHALQNILAIIQFYLREPQQESQLVFDRRFFSQPLLDASIHSFLNPHDELWNVLLVFIDHSLVLTHNPLRL